MKSATHNALVSLCLFAIAVVGKAADHTVDIFADFYSPSSLAIEVGDTVTWVSRDNSLHSVTSNTDAWDPIWLFSTGDRATLQFNTVGTYGYYDYGGIEEGLITVTAVNTAPVVTITSPTNSALLHAPATSPLLRLHRILTARFPT